MRVGSGLDVHPFREDGARPLILAGVRVRDEGGLDGHSDADVVCHAVSDALLGAAALGDLGSRFGVGLPETEGASSISLLAQVVEDVLDSGWVVVNVDVTVIAQTPQLSPHREGMRAGLAQAVDADVDDVSVKFTTTDRLGFVGRGEGIACWAVCLLAARHG